MHNVIVTTYIAQVDAWRKQREAELRAPDSWFSLVGLYILRDGYHTIGSLISNNILCPQVLLRSLVLSNFAMAKRG